MQRDCVHSDEKRASLISGRRTVASNGAAFFGALGELSATRTLAGNGLVGSVQSAPVRSSPIRKVARERWVAVGFPDGVMT